jgi:hypothetical protein
MEPTSLKVSSKTAEPMIRKFFTAMSPACREADEWSVVLPRGFVEVMTPCPWMQ